MRCIKCGNEIVEGATFCSHCGEKVAIGGQGEDKPLYQSDVKGIRKSGKLVVYHDRTEFVTSSVQKTIYNYSTLVCVRKRTGLSLGLDHIDFITENGQTESCDVNRKNVHEAFLYIEQAVKPYIAERNRCLLSQGVRYSVAINNSLGIVDGILNILNDRVEFVAKSGRNETIGFNEVKSVSISMGKLELLMTDERLKTFALDKDIREEVLAFVEKAVEPYIAKRKEELLARGIYFSCFSSYGPDSGILNIFEDRAEFVSRAGQQSETVCFRDVRAVSLFTELMEFSLTDGTSKSFSIERDIQDEALAFVKNGIQPYVQKRTMGFDLSFGVDERIEVNEQRGVFHILRQGGNEISEECFLTALVKCRQVEWDAPKSALGIFAGAAKAVGVQDKLGAPNADDIISYVGVELTVNTDSGTQTETVRFGDFSFGMSRTNKKYDRYLDEVLKFTDYLGSKYLECELIVSAIPKTEDISVEALAEDSGGNRMNLTDIVAVSDEILPVGARDAEKDQLGIAKHIEGVSAFIDTCATPMTIAIQGSRGSSKGSAMKVLSDSLERHYPDKRIWLNARLLFQSNSEDPLSMIVGRELIRQLSGAESGVSKDSAVKIAKGVIELLANVIAPDSSAGQNLVEGLFKDGSAISSEKLVSAFSRLVEERAGGSDGKVIILISELDKLAPAKGVELLEALRDFSDCEGCVFVVAIDYEFFQRGVRESSDMDLDENQEKALFDEIFQMSFRVPVSSDQIKGYVKSKLEHMGIYTDNETELGFYVELIRHSMGYESKNLDRLFNSFLLLKNLDDRELYENKVQRLILFALLCMQTKFYGVYNQLKRMRDQVTPALLSGLCKENSEIVSRCGLGGEEKTEFRGFAQVFCDIINTDNTEGISQSEYGEFAKVLEFSSITSK